MKGKEKTEFLESFKAREFSIAIMPYQGASVGLDIQFCGNTIEFEAPPTFEDAEQARGRCVRLGGRPVVRVFKLWVSVSSYGIFDDFLIS